jgi:hypothetical protein
MPNAQRETAVKLTTLRALNRATLARQMLLARHTLTADAAIERLVGLQAQIARPPFVGLWSRLVGFRRADLVARIQRREIVRATMMRGTLHIATARDFVSLRGAIQPGLTEGMNAILRERAKELDIAKLVAKARRFFHEEPRTFDDLRTFLSSSETGDIRAKAYAVRMHLPLVQVPTSEARWAYSSVTNFAIAEEWIGRPVDPEDRAKTFVKRYLAAFGPATASDVQTWSGRKGFKDVIEAMRPELAVIHDERRRELFDLPDAPRPDPETPAPARFLPEFDNVILSHADRTRILANEHRAAVYRPALQVLATILVDGFVAGTWSVQRAKAKATLVIAPFAKLPKKERDALASEGEALVRFVEEDATAFGVEFAPSG